MRTPAAVVAWAEWVVWTCNTGNLLVTVKRERTSVRSFFCAPGRAHSLGGENPLHTRQGEMLAERQRRYREVGSGGSCGQSAGLTNRKRIEATRWGETAKKVKARYLHGTTRRISDRHKREGGCAIPGEICRHAAVLRGSKGLRMCLQKSAEAIVARVTSRRAEQASRE